MGRTETLVLPMKCPACGNLAGYPRSTSSVTGVVGVLLVGLRCQDCRHEWTLETTVTPGPFTAIRKGD
jgi:hypothetical protein